MPYAPYLGLLLILKCPIWTRQQINALKKGLRRATIILKVCLFLALALNSLLEFVLLRGIILLFNLPSDHNVMCRALFIQNEKVFKYRIKTAVRAFSNADGYVASRKLGT